MVEVRAAKVARVALDIPPLHVHGAQSGDLLVVGWGSTYGAIEQAVVQAHARGVSVGHLHLRHLNPFPADLDGVLERFRRVLVPELNLGQLARLLRERGLVDVVQLNKVQGRPFTIAEINQRVLEMAR